MDKVIVFVKSGPATPRGGRLRGHGPPLLGNKGKKEIVLNQKLLKGCHQAQSITVLAILERLEIKPFLSANHVWYLSFPYSMTL